MNRKKKILVIVLFIVLLASGAFLFTGANFQRDVLSKEEYLRWVNNEDNGLRVSKKLGEFTFTLQYQPLEYLVASRSTEKELSKEYLDNKTAEISEAQYFLLKIESEQQNTELLRAGIRSQEEYFSRIEYFTSVMQNDLKLLDGKDTLSCILHHFERNYGVAPYATFVMGFALPLKKESKKSNDKTLLYNDQVLGTGTVMLTVNGRSIDNIPQLKTY